jgi:hypothetical protein
MKIRWFLASLLLMVFVSACAKKAPVVLWPKYIGKVGKVQRLDPPTKAELLAGTEGCGEYFHLVTVPATKEEGKLCFLSIVTGEAGPKLVPVEESRSSFQLKVTETSKVPQILFMKVGAMSQKLAEIRISSEDLRRSPCLSKVEVVANQENEEE